MGGAPLNSFLKFAIGFMVFVSLSLGLTFAVSSYTASRDEAQQTAATLHALLGEEN